MANHRSQAIANEFLSRRATDVRPPQMLVQKLVYIAHGWNLAINNQPLTDVPPLAWDNGPVYREIWDHIKDHGYGPKNCLLVNPVSKSPYTADLQGSEGAIIDHVWNKYAPKGAEELSRMTHEPGTPWTKAYIDRYRNAPLNNEEIRQHYKQLALAGRATR